MHAYFHPLVWWRWLFDMDSVAYLCPSFNTDLTCIFSQRDVEDKNLWGGSQWNITLCSYFSQCCSHTGINLTVPGWTTPCLLRRLFFVFGMSAWSNEISSQETKCKCLGHFLYLIHQEKTNTMYRRTSNIRRTLVGNELVNHSNVEIASPVGTDPITTSFSI